MFYWLLQDHEQPEADDPLGIIFCTELFQLCHENIKFILEKETKNKLSFLDIEISRNINQFSTSFHLKPVLVEWFCTLIVSFPDVTNLA